MSERDITMTLEERRAAAELMARSMLAEYGRRMKMAYNWDKLSASGKYPWLRRAERALGALLAAGYTVTPPAPDSRHLTIEQQRILDDALLRSSKLIPPETKP